MRIPFSLAILIFIAASCHRAPVSAPASPSSVTPGTSISVAAASDLKFAFSDLIAEFHRANPQIQVEATFGSSGNFFAQLSNNAPFDMFFSADTTYPRKLIEQGNALAGTEFLYAIGHLGIWVRNDSPLDMNRDGMAVLTDPSVRKIAIANPRFAPYGRAAEAALKHFEIYDTIQERIVLGENVSQTAQFVESGGADVGLIAESLATGSPLGDKGRFWPLPVESYPTMEQGGVILTGAKDRPACETFRAFVTSAAGKAIFQEYGFSPPPE